MSQASARLKDLEVDQIRDGTWHLDCPRVRLRRCSDAARIAFSGSGAITLNQHGQISFRFFSLRKSNLAQVLGHSDVETGTPFPEDRLFNLEAMDSGGRTWSAERVLIDLSLANSGHVLVTGRTKRVTTRAAVTKASSRLILSAFEAPRIPLSARTVERTMFPGSNYLGSLQHKRNAWRFRCLKTDFVLWQQKPDLLVFDIRGGAKSLPERFVERVTEALQVVLGAPVGWRVHFLRADGEEAVTVLSRKEPGSAHRWENPLGHMIVREPRANKHTTRFHSKLFERYLRHTGGSQKLRHNIWGHLNTAYEASAASFTDAYALALCIAVEGMLLHEFHSVAVPAAAFRSVVDDLTDYVKTWQGDEIVKLRALGSISQLKQARSDDKLRALAEQGLVRESDMRAWRELRHRLAHGDFLPGGESHTTMFYKVQVLLHHLVFGAVGYKGPYMDYGSPGWPMQEYPGSL